jgi:hypothetical protein
MLLKFSARNYLSLRDETEVSFVAAPLKELSDCLISSPYTDHGVLPVIALYGANASGKSNTLLALSFIRRFILTSFKRDADIPVRPFLLDDRSIRDSSHFVVDFVNEGIRYQFGAELTRQQVIREWLYQYPKKTRQVLYERTGDEFKFGRALSGSNRQIQSITRSNSLFLSAAATSAHPLLAPISEFFRTKLILKLTTSMGGDESTAVELEQDSDLRSEVVRYLSLADTGVADIRIKRTPIPEETRGNLAEFLGVLKKVVGEPPPEVNLPSDEFNIKIELGHASGDEQVRFLEFSDESLGTRYLLKLLPPMLKALKSGSVLVLDEITTSLHTLLARQLTSLFHDKRINKTGAQLIFSTHDTNLLAPGLLRRDEIWFAEKGRDGATVVFPLTDIRTKNTDNIERGYIQGRFGAIPFIQAPSVLIHD